MSELYWNNWCAHLVKPVTKSAARQRRKERIEQKFALAQDVVMAVTLFPFVPLQIKRQIEIPGSPRVIVN